jgi:hypothetical protein
MLINQRLRVIPFFGFVALNDLFEVMKHRSAYQIARATGRKMLLHLTSHSAVKSLHFRHPWRSRS